MKTSIIIPVYNVCDYLRQCVESVKKLTSSIEIVLIDDGSTDNSGALCDELAETDDRIKVIHQENGGLSQARNTGIKNSTGDFLLFLDSDDFLESVETDKLLAALSNDCLVYMGLYKKYFNDNNIFEEESCDGFLSLSGKVNTDTFMSVVPSDASSCYMVAVRFIVNRQFLLDNDLYFCSGIYHEDEEWTSRLLVCADSIFVSHCYFYNYRQARGGAITSALKPKHLHDSLFIIDIIQKNACALPENSVKRAYLLNRAACLYMNCVLNVCALEKQEQGAIMEKLKSAKNKNTLNFPGIKGRLLRLFNSLFGIKAACNILYMIKSITKG